MKNEFFKRYGFRILIVIVFLLPFVWMGTKRTLLSNSNNVADWLPGYFEETQQYNWFLKYFPYERFVVVSWKGCTLDDSRLEMFAQKLVPGQTIDNMTEWNESQHLRAEVALQDKTPEKADDEVPENPEPTLTSETLEEAADATAETAVSATQNEIKPSDKPWYDGYFKSVVTGPRLLHMLRERYSGDGIASMTEEEITAKLQGTLIGPDGNCTALIVTLTPEAPQGKELSKVLDAIREVGRECGVQSQIPPDTRPIAQRIAGALVSTVREIVRGRNPDMSGVIMGGPPTDNVAITHEGEHTLRRLAGICGMIGLFLAWLCFRDFRLTFFIFWIAIISAGVALASVSLTGSSCDAILLSMPALVYVLAMSGAVHMVNYYHDAVREHGLDMAPERAVGHAWYPCFFANFTTALGLVSLYTSHLVPITKFGVYSALGVMLQLLILFYYLPTLLYFYPSKKVAAERSLVVAEDSFMQKFWRVWGSFIIKNNIMVTIACFGLLVFFGHGMTQIKTSVKMMRFFSPDSEIIHSYTWLEEHLGPLVPMEIVLKFDNERCKFNMLERLRLVEDINAALREKLSDDIGGIMSAETALPKIPRSGPGRKSNRQFITERAANRVMEKNRGELRDFVTTEGNRSLRPDDEQYKQTLSELEISTEEAARLVRAGLDDIKKILSCPKEWIVAGISSEEMAVFREKAQQWERNHGTDLWRISIRVWSLKKDIDYAHFIQDVKDVADPIIADMLARQFPAEKGVDGTGAIETVYTGMVPVVYKTQHELLTGLRDSFITSFLLIGVTMSFILKSPLAGFCTMIPNVFPVVIVFGFMGKFGILVDVGTMMTASVALGIAVDDTIHFLTWFRDGIDQGMDQKEATRFAYSRCATAMFQTTLIGGLGLSAFALSTFTPTQMFGIMMLALLTAAMFGDLIFLAALLNTPIGRVFKPRKRKKRIVRETPSDNPPPSDGPSGEESHSDRRLDAPQGLPQPTRKSDTVSTFSTD